MEDMTAKGVFLRERLSEERDAAQQSYDEAGDYRIEGSEATEIHFANWKPDKVIAEVAAKERILDLRYAWSLQVVSAPLEAQHTLNAQVLAADSIIRGFLAVYDEHPDYQEWWGV